MLSQQSESGPTGRKAAAEKVAALQSEGLNGTQIAARLGISKSYAYELIHDPEGIAVRARKDSYRRTCERCGASTDGSNGPASAPTICAHCQGPEISARMEEKYGDRRDKLAELYLSGMPLKDIATAMGWQTKWPAQAAQVAVDRLREHGYDLPFRRPRRAA